MTPDEQFVYGLLMAHSIEPLEDCGGYVPVKTIAKLTGLHPRKVQDVVNCLVNNHEVLIGHSCSAKDPGNKLLEDQEEIDDEIARLDRRATAVFVRKAAIMRISVKEAARRYVQGELWEGEAA